MQADIKKVVGDFQSAAKGGSAAGLAQTCISIGELLGQHCKAGAGARRTGRPAAGDEGDDDNGERQGLDQERLDEQTAGAENARGAGHKKLTKKQQEAEAKKAKAKEAREAGEENADLEEGADDLDDEKAAKAKAKENPRGTVLSQAEADDLADQVKAAKVSYDDSFAQEYAKSGQPRRGQVKAKGLDKASPDLVAAIASAIIAVIRELVDVKDQSQN